MTARISIGCKLPNGIMLQMGIPDTEGYREIKLKGANEATVVGGFGITENVDEALFDAWYASHKTLPWAKQGLVFKAKNRAEAEARAVDNTEQKSGFERLSPDKLPKGLEEDKEAMKGVRAAAVRR